MINKNIELLNEANKLFLKKLYRDSLPIYDEILESEPGNIDVINNKGYALSKMKNYDKAILCYEQGLTINPNEKCLLINKISALRKKGNFEGAFEKVILKAIWLGEPFGQARGNRRGARHVAWMFDPGGRLRHEA